MMMLCSSQVKLLCLYYLRRSIKTQIKSTLLELSLSPSWQFLQEVGDNFIVGITPTSEQHDLIEIKTGLRSNCIRWYKKGFADGHVFKGNHDLTPWLWGCSSQNNSRMCMPYSRVNMNHISLTFMKRTSLLIIIT